MQEPEVEQEGKHKPRQFILVNNLQYCLFVYLQQKALLIKAIARLFLWTSVKCPNINLIPLNAFQVLWVNNFIKGGQTSGVDTRNSRKHKKKHVKVIFPLLFFMSDHSSKTHYQKKKNTEWSLAVWFLLYFFFPLQLVIMCVVTGMEYIGASEATEGTSDTQELANHGWLVVPINYRSLTQEKQFCFSRFQICEFGVSQIFSSACPDSYCQFWWVFSHAMGLL